MFESCQRSDHVAGVLRARPPDQSFRAQTIIMIFLGGCDGAPHAVRSGKNY